MTEAIGLIKDSIEDKRAGKLVFLSHCMLNQNACVRGLASQPAVIREIVDLALDNDVAIYQMPCPDVTYLGSMRACPRSRKPDPSRTPWRRSAACSRVDLDTYPRHQGGPRAR